MNSHHTRLQVLLAESRRLVAEAERNSRDLDQMWAARKDARRYRRQGQGPMSAMTNDLHAFSSPERQDSDWGERPEPNGPVLLLVEDSLDDFMLFRRAVAKAGLHATLRWARTGAEALSVLGLLDPAASHICVVLDVKLPDMTGFELLEAIRLSPMARDIRSVVLTGNRQPGLEQRARACGAHAFFIKPCDNVGLAEVAHALEPLLKVAREREHDHD